MTGPVVNRLRKAFRSRTTKISVALSCIAVAGSLVALTFGFPLIAIYIVVVATLIFVTLAIVMQHGATVVESELAKSENQKHAQITRLITRAEWRSGQSAREILGQLEKQEARKDDDALAVEVHKLACTFDQAQPLRNAKEARNADALFSLGHMGEKDLEILLTHMVAPSICEDE